MDGTRGGIPEVFSVTYVQRSRKEPSRHTTATRYRDQDHNRTPGPRQDSTIPRVRQTATELRDTMFSTHPVPNDRRTAFWDDRDAFINARAQAALRCLSRSQFERDFARIEDFRREVELILRGMDTKEEYWFGAVGLEGLDRRYMMRSDIVRAVVRKTAYLISHQWATTLRDDELTRLRTLVNEMEDESRAKEGDLKAAQALAHSLDVEVASLAAQLASEKAPNSNATHSTERIPGTADTPAADEIQRSTVGPNDSVFKHLEGPKIFKNAKSSAENLTCPTCGMQNDTLRRLHLANHIARHYEKSRLRPEHRTEVNDFTEFLRQAYTNEGRLRIKRRKTS